MEKSIKQLTISFLLIMLLSTINTHAQKTIYKPLDLDKLEFSFDDFGSMWTFDAIPIQKYEKKYGFKPDQKWLDDVQKSALQFGRGCSGSFVSANGLIMTNHHCIRGNLKGIEKEGEHLMRDGFYAKTLEDERKFEKLYVDQLISITDVTNVMRKAIAKGKTDAQKVDLKNKKINELIKKYEKKIGLTCKVVTLYNGGKYSLYAYKRYNDIRLVMAPDLQIAATGWDWDNFTYPRYELDFAFCRAYDENGKPVKVDNYFTWSKKGASENEPIFIIGRPGNTDRLLSMKELEYFRDIRHPAILNIMNDRYMKYLKIYKENQTLKNLETLFSVSNGRKAYAGMLIGLNDSYIMTKKYDFEKKLKTKVKADEKLNKEYGHIWSDINSIIDKIISEPKNKELRNTLEVLNQK
ncbi:MAG: hypothetical protein DRJ10_09190, partial [Bacteroidetes bacterium]